MRVSRPWHTAVSCNRIADSAGCAFWRAVYPLRAVKELRGLAGNLEVSDEPISEDPFRLLVQSILDYAIYMLDPNGFVTSWNAGAERIKGFQTDEIVGKHFSTFYTEEDREAGMPERGPRDRAARRQVRGRRLARPQGRHRASGRASWSTRIKDDRARSSASPRSPAT